jgi:hypothetical protein
VVRRPLHLASVALAAVLAVALPMRARAANSPHYDLTSLATESQAIVLADRTGELHVDGGVVARLRVVQSFAGPLVAGNEIEVNLDDYPASPSGGWGTGQGWGAGRNAVVAHNVFLFLAERDTSAPSRWTVVSSGVRIVVDGVVYRYEQESNPGGYGPVPQGNDPFDVLGDPLRRGGTVDATGFTKELLPAIARATAIRAALAEPKSEGRARRLVDLVGPPPDLDADDATPAGVFEGRWAPFSVNYAAVRVLKALIADGDLHATLDALTRARGVCTLDAQHTFTTEALVAIANDTSRPLAERVAAVHAVGQVRPTARRDTPHGNEAGRYREEDAHESTALLPLLDDPRPELRSAALDMAKRDSPALLATAIERRWRVETDPHVRFSLFTHAKALHLLGQLHAEPGTLPLIDATRTGREVHVAWAGAEDEPAPMGSMDEAIARRRSGWEAESIVVEARRAGDEAAAVVAFPILVVDGAGRVENLIAYNVGQGGGEVTGFLANDPRLRTGRWDLRLALTVTKGAQRVSRQVALGPMLVKADTSSTELPQAVHEAAEMPGVAATIGPRAGACACALARGAAPGAASGGWMAAAAALAAWAWRRRGRRLVRRRRRALRPIPTSRDRALRSVTLASSGDRLDSNDGSQQPAGARVTLPHAGEVRRARGARARRHGYGVPGSRPPPRA